MTLAGLLLDICLSYYAAGSILAYTFFLTNWALTATMVFVAHRCYVQHSTEKRQSQSQMRLSAWLLELAHPLNAMAVVVYWPLLHKANMARPAVIASPLRQALAYVNHSVPFLVTFAHTQISHYELFDWNGINQWPVAFLYSCQMLFLSYMHGQTPYWFLNHKEPVAFVMTCVLVLIFYCALHLCLSRLHRWLSLSEH